MFARRKLLIGLGYFLAWPAARAFAQQAKMPRVGILSARSRSTPSNPDPYFDAFSRGLRELGYVDGKNVILDWWFADDRYERLPELAAGMVKTKPDLIVTHATPAAAALMKATTTIPIVITSASDPVGSGFTTSLSRPDKNLTGLVLLTTDLNAKYIELLKQLLPKISQVAVLMNPGMPAHPRVLESVKSAAQAHGVQVDAFPAANREEISAAFAQAQKKKLHAMIVMTDSLFVAQRRHIARLGLQHRIATITNARLAVADGCLMSYGSVGEVNYHRAATYVDRLLKGAKPADLPIEQPAKFLLAVNLRTAKALGLKVPQEILGRADEVIE